MNFSATPPLELAKLMMSMVATAQWDQTAWLGQEGHEQFRDRGDAHGHQQSELSVSMQKKTLNCHLRCGAKDVPTMDGSECRCTALVTQPQTGRMRTPKYNENISSTVSMFIVLTCEEPGLLFTEDFISGGPKPAEMAGGC